MTGSTGRDAVRVYYATRAVTGLLFALMATLNIVYQATVVGLGPLQLVLVGTLLEMVCFVGEVPTGLVADLYSRRLSVIIGLALIGAGFTLEVSVPTFGSVLGAQALWGIGATFTSGAREAWIADEAAPTHNDRGIARIFTRGTQLELVGTIVGIVGIVGSGALGLISIRLPLLVSGLGYVALAGGLVVVMPERHFAPVPAGGRTTFGRMTAQLRDGITLARDRRVVRTLMLVSIVAGLASEAFDRLWQCRLLHAFTFPSVFGRTDRVLWFAAIALVGTLLSLVVSAGLTRLSPGTLVHLHPPRLMAVLAAVQVAATAAYALVGVFGVAVAMLWARQIAGVIAAPVGTA